MSSVNIKRAVENIRGNTTVYTPIVEVIVNAIQAIESNECANGKIDILVIRDKHLEMDIDGSLPEVRSFKIRDNGIGFTNENRRSFDTLYSDYRIDQGGKGFGRFTCLKYFENLHVDSIYQDDSGFKQRRFSMGKNNDIIINEKISDSSEQTSGSVVHLSMLKKRHQIDKKLETMARILVEKLLPYFIIEDYVCPPLCLH